MLVTGHRDLNIAAFGVVDSVGHQIANNALNSAYVGLCQHSH